MVSAPSKPGIRILFSAANPVLHGPTIAINWANVTNVSRPDSWTCIEYVGDGTPRSYVVEPLEEVAAALAAWQEAH